MGENKKRVNKREPSQNKDKIVSFETKPKENKKRDQKSFQKNNNKFQKFNKDNKYNKDKKFNKDNKKEFKN